MSKIDEQNYHKKYSLSIWSSSKWLFDNLYEEVGEKDAQNYSEKYSFGT